MADSASRWRSPAKINLFLHVTGKRPDGYHELFSLMCCVSLCDDIRLEFGGAGIRVRCDDPAVPQDEGNLAWRAAERFLAASGRRPPGGGLKIHITKRIPVAAGLGGGSSNAATVLKALNEICGRPLAASELARIALGIGADVPFFVFGRPALASGIGERLEPFTGLPRCWVVIVFPGLPLSTAAVFSRLNLRLTNHEKKPTRALLKNRGFRVPEDLHNDLEAVALAVRPEIAEVKAALAMAGASGVLMSGSGPSVFGLFDSGPAAAAARRTLAQRRGWRVFDGGLLADAADRRRG